MNFVKIRLGILDILFRAEKNNMHELIHAWRVIKNATKMKIDLGICKAEWNYDV